MRCKQLTLLLDWAEQFEAESRHSDEAVAFSVLLGDLNFDNCSLDNAQEQEHKLFSRFQDPCRLGTRRDQPWALGTEPRMGTDPGRRVRLPKLRLKQPSPALPQERY